MNIFKYNFDKRRIKFFYTPMIPINQFFFLSLESVSIFLDFYLHYFFISNFYPPTQFESRLARSAAHVSSLLSPDHRETVKSISRFLLFNPIRHGNALTFELYSCNDVTIRQYVRQPRILISPTSYHAFQIPSNNNRLLPISFQDYSSLSS